MKKEKKYHSSSARFESLSASIVKFANFFAKNNFPSCERNDKEEENDEKSNH